MKTTYFHFLHTIKTHHIFVQGFQGQRLARVCDISFHYNSYAYIEISKSSKFLINYANIIFTTHSNNITG